MGDARVAYPKTTKDETFEEIKRLPFTKETGSPRTSY